MPSSTAADSYVESENAGRIPVDLTIIFLWILFALIGIYVSPLSESALRVIFAIPFILFIPGYLLIAALFPARDGIDGIERVALSFGLSIAIVPLVGIGLNYTPFGIRLDPIVISLVAFSVVMGSIALYRRSWVPGDSRFTVRFPSRSTTLQDASFNGGASMAGRALTVVLVASLVVAAGMTAYVVAVPKKWEQFTEFYILGQRGKAADYPSEFAAGTPQMVIIGIGNHEDRDITYTVETLAVQQVFDEATNQSSVASAEPLDRFTVTVPHNTTVEQPYSFRITDPAVNRVEFLLFKDPSPGTLTGADRISASYRNLHLWVRVEPA